ncbi:MAG: amidophosphoribosyltransferase [Planctomycetota bacterium]
MREECGIIGVYGVEGASELAHVGLHALQHRGQESAGIVASDGSEIQSVKGLGLLSEAIDASDLQEVPGHLAIGHTRYSTTGGKRVQNIQPLVIEYSEGIVAVGHNGNLSNAKELRRRYQDRGAIFQTSSDSELIVHLLADPEWEPERDPLAEALRRVEGAYSLVMMDSDQLIAARDPHGFRPLSLGRLDDGYMVASETCAFDLLEADEVREIEPGEIVRIDEDGVRSSRIVPEEECTPAMCIFEYIYFARPDSIMGGQSVHTTRLKLGEKLAEEHPVDADLVTSVPDSGNSAALGYARASGIPPDSGFIRNHYVGRTFITPAEEARASKVKIKLNVVKDVVEGQRVVVVDDSIVRGTTSRERIHTLRDVGAQEVHLRISAPPIRCPCYFGIDFAHEDELIAANRSVEEIRDFLGVDTLGYQSIEGLMESVPGCGENYCRACFTGEYPVEVEEDMHKYALEARRG